jgi:2',3'-cyclic-nucleotide 2'-phosphodiesterase/3'-nucleotidase
MRSLYPIIFLILLLTLGCREKTTVVRIATTTDVHGMIYPYDLVRREPADHSLSHICNYVSEQRQLKDTLFFLLDNGDFLQGQPTVYYYNFVDTSSQHLSSRVMNYLGYSAGTVGNHDIEAGPKVYNRIREEFSFPWLAANAIKRETGEPYFEPYTVLEAGKKKIAVLGLITPGIPHWLPPNLWPGMEFTDMVETARKWVPVIMEKEKPDLLIGLFHSGTDASYGGSTESFMNENAILLVAELVPGFDVIFAGHDHRVSAQWVTNILGDSVLVVDPGSHARFAGEITIAFGPGDKKHIQSRNVPMNTYEPSPAFQQQFSEEFEQVSGYLNDTITWLTEEMQGVDAIFGPSAMMTLIHNVQLELSGAHISFTAPLSLNATLNKGPVLVSDMFKLYRFENMLYSMELSGAEIDAFLEYAAGLWFNTMAQPTDHLLRFSNDNPGRLANPYYNFSSAAGIDYSIDVTLPAGERVTILGFTDGTIFTETETYLVALNSYRGNGGGGHLSKGAGIPAEELAQRITWSTEIDLRYHIMNSLSDMDQVYPEISNNWSILPEEWVKRAIKNDRKYFN